MPSRMVQLDMLTSIRGLRGRVFAEIYQMLKKQEYPYDRDIHNHETKISQYRKFLEKKK
jgi:hypothetical protein